MPSSSALSPLLLLCLGRAELTPSALFCFVLRLPNSKLSAVPAMQFAVNSSKLPAPQLALEAFDAIHNALLQIASDEKRVPQAIRDRCLELLTTLAVTRGSLAYFLTGQSPLLSHPPFSPLVLRSTTHLYLGFL